jgi:hypothetical protein
MSNNDEEWLDQLKEALDALEKVIKSSKPGTGWSLHKAYTAIERGIERVVGEAESPPVDEQQEDLEYWQMRETWKQMPLYQRERRLLEVLADNRLTIRELRERLNERCGPDSLSLDESQARSLVYSMFKSGELDRCGERFARTRTRYRYFRRTDLTGPIAELDRAFEQEGGTE